MLGIYITHLYKIEVLLAILDDFNWKVFLVGQP